MKKTISGWLNILVGCIILAAGFVFFINPYNIVPGGVYGASIVLHNLFPSIQVGTFGYMFDIPLLILSVIFLGTKLGARTIAAALTTPLLMNVMSRLAYPTREALHALDPSQLLGGIMDLSDHLMLTSVMGAVLIGIGSGIVVKNQATTGGSDIVAMMLQKYMHIRFSRAILLVDGIVVCFGLLVIGFGLGSGEIPEEPSVYLSLYSLIAIFICSRVIAYMITGAKNDKLIFVISDKELPDLHKYILKDLDRTATCIKSSGLYTKEEKEMIFLVVSYKEVAGGKNTKKIDHPPALVVGSGGYETFCGGREQMASPTEDWPG